MTEKGVAHAKDTYAKVKMASEEAARAAFDYAHELIGVKSPMEFIELSTAQMRKQFDIASAQNKDLCALAQQVATETAEPITTGVSKAFKKAA
jgi:hypothetical protein